MPMRWYVIHVHSGSEKKVAELIQHEADRVGLSSSFEEISVPSEQVMEMKRGQKTHVERKFLPGYVLAKMEMSDVTWHLVKEIPKVITFLGTKTTPTPIPEKQAMAMLNKVKDASAGKPRNAVLFEIGQSVRVADGPFTSFSGTVEEVDEERSRLKVSVTIFGRSTNVELEFNQVETAA